MEVQESEHELLALEADEHHEDFNDTQDGPEPIENQYQNDWAYRSGRNQNQERRYYKGQNMGYHNYNPNSRRGHQRYNYDGYNDGYNNGYNNGYRRRDVSYQDFPRHYEKRNYGPTQYRGGGNEDYGGHGRKYHGYQIPITQRVIVHEQQEETAETNNIEEEKQKSDDEESLVQ